MRGAKDLDVDWRDGQLECDGSPRPDRSGIRLTFAGPIAADGRRLRFVFGIVGAQHIGISRDLPVNVTVIFEDDHRLYATRGANKCTIDVLDKNPVATDRGPKGLRVTGRGFCIAPATAGDGGAGLLLSRFDFSGTALDSE